jgi:hypothetical protein
MQYHRDDYINRTPEPEPLERDPVRPAGLWLVLVAAIALGSLGYAIYPRQGSEQAGPLTGGGGPSANTNPEGSPQGK